MTNTYELHKHPIIFFCKTIHKILRNRETHKNTGGFWVTQYFGNRHAFVCKYPTEK